MPTSSKADTSFLAFFLIWAQLQGWKVPLLHVRICHWLDTCNDRVRVLMVFRGAAKSTIYAVWKAYKLWKNPENRTLIYAADDDLAGKMTRDTLNVLRRHPLCQGMLPAKPGAFSFWVNGSTDARNPSMEAIGMNSNSTGSRADDADFDDIEVPKNIKTPEARQNVRQKIEESTHILVPGWQKTFVGTPHTHDSIYPEQIAGGAACLKIPLFECSHRYTDTNKAVRYPIPFEVMEDGLYVMRGIGKFSRMLVEGVDYRVKSGEVWFDAPPKEVIDLYGQCSWPERFTREEVELKRRETRTLNAWDSQYQLEAKPISEVRLDPERIIPYAVEPETRTANKVPTLWIGQRQMVGAIAWWDCALGKIKGDASPISVVYTDAQGKLYLHACVGLTGDLDDQCDQAAALLKRLRVHGVCVETNGPGGFVPAALRKALVKAAHTCGVIERHSVVNKQKRILDAWEPPLSSRFIYAHVGVLNGPLWDQLKDFNPEAKNQADDYIDSSSGAISETPVRIGKADGNPTGGQTDDWRTGAGVHEVTLEL